MVLMCWQYGGHKTAQEGEVGSMWMVECKENLFGRIWNIDTASNKIWLNE